MRTYSYTPAPLPLSNALALCLQRRCAPTVLRAFCQNSFVLGRPGGTVHTPKHSNLHFGSTLPIKAAKEEIISIPAKKLLICLNLGTVCVCQAKRRVLSSPFDCQSLIALQIPLPTLVASSCVNTSDTLV